MLKKVEMFPYLHYDGQKCIYGIEASGVYKGRSNTTPLSLVRAIVPTITNVDKMKNRLATYEVDNIELIRKLAYIKGSNIHAPFNIKNISIKLNINDLKSDYIYEIYCQFLKLFKTTLFIS